jgi:hypothetical protein
MQHAQLLREQQRRRSTAQRWTSLIDILVGWLLLGTIYCWWAGVPWTYCKRVADAQERATKLNQDFNRAIAKETENTTNNINKLYRDTYEAIAKATEENAAEVAKANADAAKQIADAQSARNSQERPGNSPGSPRTAAQG